MHTKKAYICCMEKQTRKKRSEIHADYDGFVEKFKPKKTTDDCFTPPKVYQAVLDFVNREIMPLEGVKIIRPFWPGADYQAAEYPKGCVVIDNPPFSILARIREFYQRRGIRYFLFAPELTCLSSSVCSGDTVLVCGSTLTYENGAKVATAFVTNMLPDLAIWVCGDLGKAVLDACAIPNKQPPKYKYDQHVVSTAILSKYARPGISWKIPREDCSYVRKLDCQNGKTIFGNGYLISERAAAERAAARETYHWTLSEREWEIVRSLGKK